MHLQELFWGSSLVPSWACLPSAGAPMCTHADGSRAADTYGVSGTQSSKQWRVFSALVILYVYIGCVLLICKRCAGDLHCNAHCVWHIHIYPLPTLRHHCVRKLHYKVGSICVPHCCYVPLLCCRIIAAVARQHLLPPVLATVHKRFGTPWVATLLSGVATAVIALFTGALCS